MFHRCVANLASDCTTGPATSPYRRLDLGTAEEGVRASFGEGTEKCQGRMKIPHFAGRRFPTSQQAVVDANHHFLQHG